VHLKKSISVFLIQILIIQIILPIPLYAAQKEDQQKGYRYIGDMVKRFDRDINPKDRSFTPDEVQDLIDQSVNPTFSGNPTLRQEESNIIRPIKQVGLKVLDSEIGIVQTFLSYEAARFLKASFTDSRINYHMAKARQAIYLLSKSQAESLTKFFTKVQIGPKIKVLANSMGPKVKNFVATEANFALMSVLGALIWMGVYDSLDVYALKDRVLSLDPLNTNSTWSHTLIPDFLGATASRHVYGFFNNQFDKVYERMLKSKGFGSHLLKSLDKRADILGKKILKSARLGLKPAGGESLAAKLGLVGIGEGTQFTLQGFLRNLSAGVAYGLVINLVVDTVVVGARGYSNSSIVGANRDVKIRRPEYNGYLYQRTGSKAQDWLKERKFALMDMLDGYSKNPLTKFVSTLSGWMGAYGGSVVAGAVLVGGGIPAMVGGVMIASVFAGVGSFLGDWLTTKFERGDSVKNLRRSFVERRLFKVIKKMKIFDEGNIDLDEARTIAKDRSWDMYKRESMGQTYSRMFLVESFDHIELFEKKGIVHMKVDEEHGEELNKEAHMRYDFVDLNGHRGIWDYGTKVVYNVGLMEKNNGYTVIFISDSDQVDIRDGILLSEKGSKFRVLSNGIIMTPSELNPKDWAIRGINVNTDVFTRSSKTRFTWDYDREAYRRVDLTTGVKMTLHPLLPLIGIEDEKEFKSRLDSQLQVMIDRSFDKSVELVEKVKPSNFEEFSSPLSQLITPNSMNWFQSMETSQWKNILVGRMRRSQPHRLSEILEKLHSQETASLKQALLAEIQNPNTKSAWDNVQELLDQNRLIANHVQ